MVVASLSHVMQGALGPRNAAQVDGGPGGRAGKDKGIWWMEDMGRGSGQGSLCSGDVVSEWMSVEGWDQGGVSPWLTGGWRTPWGDPLGPPYSPYLVALKPLSQMRD